jgi:hypothetical protein
MMNSYEFLSLIALGLAPKPAIARRIARILALRDDALRLCAASGLQKSWAIADVVIAVLNRSRRTFDQGFQAFLSLHKAQPGHLPAVEKQEIKDEIHKVGRASLVGRGLHPGKGGGPV